MNPPRNRFLAAGLTLGFLVLVAAIFFRLGSEPSDRALSTPGMSSSPRALSTPASPSFSRERLSNSLPPEEVVAKKLAQFARQRLGVLNAMAQKNQLPVPFEVGSFFAAVEAGDFPKAESLYRALVQRRDSGFDDSETLWTLWPPILETFGTAEVAAEWPAQALLDYGQAILNALPPDSVYLGGTDPGRFIPTLLNETSGGDRHIILTQNALADNTYLGYIGFLYEGRLATLSNDESASAFSRYLADAQKRLQHDQTFPDEPKQLRPGEQIQMSDNRVQVSGATAVMAINELLLTKLIQNNPELAVMMEESFPFKSLYADAVPSGPLLQLRAGEAAANFSAEQAAATVDFWRNTAQKLVAGSSVSEEREAYAKLALAHGGWLDHHNFTIQAEQAYQIALQLSPSSSETRARFAEWLARAGREEEARKLLNVLPPGPRASPTP